MSTDPAIAPALRLLSARLACREPEAVAYVRGHLERARTLQEAAAALGCSLRTASRWARELGLSRTPGAKPATRTAKPGSR